MKTIAFVNQSLLLKGLPFEITEALSIVLFLFFYVTPPLTPQIPLCCLCLFSHHSLQGDITFRNVLHKAIPSMESAHTDFVICESNNLSLTPSVFFVL